MGVNTSFERGATNHWCSAFWNAKSQFYEFAFSGSAIFDIKKIAIVIPRRQHIPVVYGH